MKHSFINLLREPDSVLFQYDDSCLRFEEFDGKEEQVSHIDYIVEDGCGKIIVYPCDKGIKRVKLRWRGDMSDVLLMLGDELARIVSSMDGNWVGLCPEKKMPWYFQVFDGEKINCFGVKTQPNAFCHFQCDQSGITLWVDLRSGGSGVLLKEPLEAAQVVCMEGDPSHNPFEDARAFCRMMCPNPNLPKEPVFGANNWYWAYGNISHDIVMEETKYLKEMTRDCVCNPYMIIDDGWQLLQHTKGSYNYNGGPWSMVNDRFTSMEYTAKKIKEMGAKPGIWFRPLRTAVNVPEEAISKTPIKFDGIPLDCSHPYVLENVAKDVQMIRGWGYELIKHDFSTYDTIGRPGNPDSEHKLYDNSITTCMALKKLYNTIQQNAGGAVVIGCNTINHLSAGIHQVQRASDDTSGNHWALSRRNGVHCLVRLPQNGTFFQHDPDCAAFTHRVDHDINLDFLEACAITGATAIASVTPGCLTKERIKRIHGIYRTASIGGLGAIPSRWIGNDEPNRFETPDGKEYIYDWYKIYDGVRNFLEWSN